MKDLASNLLPLVGDSILKGLQDPDDDVRAVAASALLPVADQLHVTFAEKVSFNKKCTLTFVSLSFCSSFKYYGIVFYG